jgi:FMN-dependent NADH-azoreductase
MAKLLYIRTSPRGERSHSNAVGDAFVEAYRAAHPGDEVVVWDVFRMALPTFDGFALQAKYAILHGQSHSDEERAAWRAVESVIEEFKSADKYLLASPMWNFGIPYRLKHLLDVLIQPGYTFGYSAGAGYTGLVTGKPIVLALARGGEYPPGTPGEAFDLQRKYLELALGFIGFTDIRLLTVEPTLQEGPERAMERRTAAIAAARELAVGF